VLTGSILNDDIYTVRISNTLNVGVLGVAFYNHQSSPYLALITVPYVGVQILQAFSAFNITVFYTLKVNSNFSQIAVSPADATAVATTLV
jgi:hypothetical protein